MKKIGIMFIVMVISLSGCIWFGDEKTLYEITDEQAGALEDIISFKFPDNMDIIKVMYSNYRDTFLEITSAYPHEEFERYMKSYMESTDKDQIEKRDGGGYRIIATSTYIDLNLDDQHVETIRFTTTKRDLNYSLLF